MLPAWSAPESPFLSPCLAVNRSRGENQPCQCAVFMRNSMKTQVWAALAALGRAPSGQDHASATSPCSHAQPQETHSSSECPVPRTSSPLCRATVRQHSGMVLGQLPALPARCQGTGVLHISASIPGLTGELAGCLKLVKIAVMELQRGGRPDCKVPAQLLQKSS